MNDMTPGQESDEWHAARIGKLTASRIFEAIDKKKNGEFTAARKKYMVELLAERFTGMAAEPYLSSSMLWGIETEPNARKAYEAKTGSLVARAPFVDHPSIPMAGASPDSYVDDDGLLEIKCPETRTHIGYLMDRAIPENYVVQMQWQLACTGRAFCDFVSFDPRMPGPLQLLIVRTLRDQRYIDMLELMAAAFLREMTYVTRALESGHVVSDDL